PRQAGETNMKGSRVDRCFACGSAKFGSELHRASYRYLICSDCGSGLLPGGSEEATYEAGYFTAGKSHGYFDYAGDRRLHRETAGRRLDALLSVVPGTRTIVDVGAALGFTLEVAKERGLEAIGVERSRYATEQLTGRGFTVHQTLGALEPASTDAVIFGQVLEHMPEPGLALRQAFAAIRPGGGLFIETWDFASSTAQRFGARWQQVA